MNTRRGFTLIELSVAGTLLAVVAVITLQILGAWAAASRAERQQRVALAEVDNLLERLTTWPWDELVPEKLQNLTPSPAAEAILPGARLTASVADRAEDDVPARRIAVEIRYGGDGRAARSVRLVAWRYPTAEEQRP